MTADNATVDEATEAEPEPRPERIDWWVWGVRQLAGFIAGLLIAGRGLIVIFFLVKLVTWLLTRNADDLYQAVFAVPGFFAAWACAMLLGRFSEARDTPDPFRWMAQQLNRRRRETP
jgi:hypothetical protein